MAAPTLPDRAREQLSLLREEAARDEGRRAAYASALAELHRAGWSYRQIGAGLGLSHESIRLTAAQAPQQPLDPGIEIPPRPRPRAIRTIERKELPEDLRASLAALLEAASGEDTGERTASELKPAVAELFAALHAASEAGWDAHSLAAAIGSHPKAVYKFVAHHARYADAAGPAGLPEAPGEDAPRLARARRVPFPPTAVPEDAVQHLHELDAQSWWTQPQYLSLLGAWYLRGAARKELERATGLKWETVRKRLVRGGYMAGTVNPS